MSQEFYIGYLIVIGFVSFITFILYGVDKFKAKRNLWRIKESVLLLFGFLGGAVGALIGMNLFHHKTRHWYFWAVNILGIVWQLSIPIFAAL